MSSIDDLIWDVSTVLIEARSGNRTYKSLFDYAHEQTSLYIAFCEGYDEESELNRLYATHMWNELKLNSSEQARSQGIENFNPEIHFGMVQDYLSFFLQQSKDPLEYIRQNFVAMDARITDGAYTPNKAASELLIYIQGHFPNFKFKNTLRPTGS